MAGRVLVPTILVSLILFAVPSGHGAPPPIGIALFGDSGRGWGFTSTSNRIPGPDISLFTGGILRLSLVSTDGLVHNFWVDYNGNRQPDPGEPISGNFSNTVLYEFGASTPGNYTYMCVHHPDTMFGRFNVLKGGPTALIVLPGKTESVLGSGFRIAFYLANVQDLYAYRIRASFEPTIVQATNISLKGTWPEASGIPFAPSPSNFMIDNTRGEISLEVWIQGTFPGWTGSGTLAYVNFTSIASGNVIINIEETVTVLLDSQFREIAHATVDGANADNYMYYALTGGMVALVLASALYLNRERNSRVRKNHASPND